jgi:hypothetical protein
MADRVSFSAEEQSLEEIANHHADVQAGIFEFFAGSSRTLLDRYADSKVDEVRDRSLVELSFTSSLSVLSSVEAAIRLDYLRRVYGRWRDPLSRSMKELHKDKENRARLEDDLIGLWRDHTDVSVGLLGALVGAFKYRHWLAHGRYWTPKFGRQYDYETVYDIAQEFIDAMDSYNVSCDRGNVRENL